MNKILIVTIVSIVAAATGFVTYKKINEPVASNSKPTVAPTALATATLAATAEPHERPMATTLPDFSLPNRAGESQSIRSWPGKSMIINFWATWCGPCRHEIPLLNEVAKNKADANFQVVGIAIDYRDDVLKYTEKTPLDYPLFIGEQEGLSAAQAFGVDSAGLPFTVFTDKQGHIVTLFVGELSKPKIKVLLDGVASVNRGELTPEAARAAIATQLKSLAG